MDGGQIESVVGCKQELAAVAMSILDLDCVYITIDFEKTSGRFQYCFGNDFSADFSVRVDFNEFVNLCT